MASVDGTSIPASAQAKVNGILEQDAARSRVPVHTFDPDASPEAKAASAGKETDKLGLESEATKTGGKGTHRPIRIRSLQLRKALIFAL